MAEYRVKTSESGAVQGPFSGRQLRTLANSGQLQPHFLVSQDNGVSWNEASRYEGLAFVDPDHPLIEVDPDEAGSGSPTTSAERLEEPQVGVVPLSELIESDSPITSAQLIASLASRHGTGFQDTANVVDGFWNHLLDSGHYHQGRRSLVMPHFGTFSLKRTQDGQTELCFQSQPLSILRLHRSSSGPHRPSTKWIEHWQQHPPSQQRIQRLSLKRKLAVAIDQEIDLDLQTTFLILWDHIETITAIMARGQSDIRWAKRGVMKRQPNTSTAYYSFRTYKRLTDQLPALPEPATGGF
jgi:hypothetical protein